MITVYFDPAYAAAEYEFPTTRKARWIVESLIANPIPGIHLQSPAALTESQLLSVHDADYIRAVLTGEPRSLAESQELEWDPGLWPMVLSSNGGTVAAAVLALKEGAAGSLSSGLHHARRERGAGYCTFNGLAIAALAACDAGAGDVLVLDLDAHCGGGTHSIVGQHEHIWQIDVSTNRYDLYEPGDHTSLDIVENAVDYLPTIERRLREAAGRRLGLCLYNAGMDPHESCPAGALAGITDELLRKRENLVFEWCRERNLPIAFVMAGGYVSTPYMKKDHLVELHRLTLQAAAETRPGWR
jgi:acetoin utilization deacetylase AcuC-like enzyme